MECEIKIPVAQYIICLLLNFSKLLRKVDTVILKRKEIKLRFNMHNFWNLHLLSVPL